MNNLNHLSMVRVVVSQTAEVPEAFGGSARRLFRRSQPESGLG